MTERTKRVRPEGVPKYICSQCLMRPVMDRCDVCEECWYSPVEMHHDGRCPDDCRWCASERYRQIVGLR